MGLQYDDFNGRIIHIHPLKTNFKEKILKLASDKIAKELYHKHAFNSQIEIIHLIEAGAFFSDASLIHGKWFEELAHEQLQKGGQFFVQCLEDESKSLKTMLLTLNVDELKAELNGLKLSKNAKILKREIKSEFYNRPHKKKQESVDSLVPHEHEPDHIYQITVGKNHPIKVNGFKELHEYLHTYHKIYLYFVVPKDKFEDFSYQKYVTTTEESLKGGINQMIGF
ncbi:10879_t:CDS:2 [Entrophospora sp. SA101]|nr:12820_t:CDS:2 [Entrophospora sp. SA101]CAJ0837986.1 10879_t:CDS:2 [Entrophospora sp. SA101]